MNENPPAPRRGKSCLVLVLVALLLAVIGIGVAWWWHNRPIEPVVLTPQEKQVVERKVEAIQKSEPPAEDPVYEKGTREIILTERELNGLLNENTTLGDSVRFQLATGEVHARIETDLDPDLPVLGGKKLKARARFLVEDETGNPTLVLDDHDTIVASIGSGECDGAFGRCNNLRTATGRKHDAARWPPAGACFAETGHQSARNREDIGGEAARRGCRSPFADNPRFERARRTHQGSGKRREFPPQLALPVDDLDQILKILGAFGQRERALVFARGNSGNTP